MRISELLEAKHDPALLAPNAYSILLGKAIAKVIVQIKNEYNSLRSVYADDDVVDLEMYAGSNVPVASMMKKAAKELQLPIVWTFYKENRGNEHGYMFEFEGLKLDLPKLKKAILDDEEAQEAYMYVHDNNSKTPGHRTPTLGGLMAF